jgi:general secretion pathway protein K
LNTGSKATQQGVALLTALFVVALATIAAVSLMSTSAIALHRTSTMLDSEQAEWYARGIESWGWELLQKDAASKGGSKAYDSLADDWAQPIPQLPLDNRGSAAGRIVDLQGLFNLRTQHETLGLGLPGRDFQTIFVGPTKA